MSTTRRRREERELKMKAIQADIVDLWLDVKNPRLPEDLAPRTQEQLAEHIANEYNTIDVARSMVEHGYFDSEPLVAIKSGGKLVVVEGNRRLTALKVLTDSKLRKSIALEDAEEWERLASGGTLDSEVPVHVAKDRRSVAPVIGFRHISGIEPWDPWAKARFIAAQIEDEGLSFEETARIVGERPSDIRTQYRNYRIAFDAEKKLKVSARDAKNKFGFFTRAMNSPGLRDHIGAPSPADVNPKKPVLKPSKKKEVAELFSWLFGTGSEEAVLTDSRQISDLGQVVASAEGLDALRATRRLDDAMLASGGVRDRLLRRLETATTALETAELDIESYRDDPAVDAALDQCAEALKRLRSNG